MLDLYRDQVARAGSDNMIRQVHLAFENELAPAELEWLAAGIEASGAGLPRLCHEWGAGMRALMRAGTPRIHPFVRQPVGHGAALYAAPGGPQERGRRTLLVAFAGDARRLMLPISLFLQHCDPERHEVLLLFDLSQSFFLRGMAGIAPDLGALQRWIDGQVRARAAARTIVVGCSAGGLAAVWTAVALGYPRVVSFGGTTPGEVAERHHTQDLDVSGFAEAIRLAAGALPEVAYVYGDACERDRLKGQALAACLPVTAIPVPACDRHNVLWELLRRRELAGWLDRLLGEPPVANPAP